ncbi:MAG: hypothetical protein NT027_06625 [Proteobacteria bacterium]|nr:hypothetical protein [Pseudomonadota bacterium]
MSLKFGLFLLPFLLPISCKPRVAKETSNQLAGSRQQNTDNSCSHDPKKIAEMLGQGRGYRDGKFLGGNSDYDKILGEVCGESENQRGRVPGANDPVCGAYCDTCESHGLPTNADHLIHEFSVPLKFAKLFESLGIAKAGEAAALGLREKFALAFEQVRDRRLLGVMHGIEAVLCAASIYDMAVSMEKIINYDSQKFGQSETRFKTDLMCGINLAIQTCEAVPGLSAVFKPTKKALDKIPGFAPLSAAVAFTCPVGQFLADKVIQCPAFKNACKESIKLAQPISETECCVCGLASNDGARMIEVRGGGAYAGKDRCEDENVDVLRRRYGISSSSKPVCRRVEVDFEKTHGCGFGGAIYGANLTCGRDNKKYLIPHKIYLKDGGEIEAPRNVPSYLSNVDTKWTSMSELRQIVQRSAQLNSIEVLDHK